MKIIILLPLLLKMKTNNRLEEKLKNPTLIMLKKKIPINLVLLPIKTRPLLEELLLMETN